MDFLQMIPVALYVLQSCMCSAKPGDYFKEINSTEGVVQSPKYPRNYQSNRTYRWRITVRETFIIRLVFNDFDLQRKQQGVCKDKLQIYDGEGENSPTIFIRCGGSFDYTSRPVFSAGNALFLKLTTDRNKQRNGFSANFTSLKLKYHSEELNSTEGVVQSPKYPLLYPSTLRYTWRISVRETFIIRLVFTDFLLQQSIQEVCPDKLQIYDGEDENSSTIFTECGGPLNDIPPVSSSGHVLFLKLSTDGRKQKRGFSANFTSVPRRGSFPIKATQVTSATTRATTTTTELFDLTTELRKTRPATYPLLMPSTYTTVAEQLTGGTTDFPFNAFSSSKKSTANVPLVSKVLHSFTPYLLSSVAPSIELTSSGLRSNTSVAIYASVSSVLLMLCLLGFGVFIFKKSLKQSLSPTTDHSYHSATTTNQDADVAQPPEFMVDDCRIERCNTIPLSEFVTMNNDGEENGKDIKADKSSDGEILNIVYESYDDKLNKAADFRGEDHGGVAKSNMTYEEVGEKHSVNIVYESYDEVNEDVDLRGEDDGVTKSDMTCHEDSGVAKQDTTYEEVGDKHSFNTVYDDICPEREEGFEINIIYEPFDRDGKALHV